MSEETWALLCPDCRFPFPEDITMGVVKAHMSTEHNASDDSQIRLELTPLCTGDRQPMTLVGKTGERTFWQCGKCRRSRIIRQDPT